MSSPKPICGTQGAGSTDSVWDSILLLWGLVGTVAGVIGAITNAAATTTIPILGITGAGVGLIGLSAAAAALAVVFTVLAFAIDRCSHPDGLNTCSSGVVNEIVESFDEAADEVFPFIAMHDRVDVVVKRDYWHLVQNAAQFVKCAGDSIGSPIIQCLYETPAVCAAAVGATVGAIVGGIGGIVVGIIVGAAIGCAGSGPFYFFCLLLACIIAAIIAAVIALVGAFIGGQIGKAAADDPSPTNTEGSNIRLGDYITTKGNLIVSASFDGARVYWFVTETTLHGQSTGSPQFSHTDPDTNLTMDACPRDFEPPK
ncbi:MAG TPA: hypothetical protein VM864_02545 [Pyrinomonadaceae bacterium]|jgi:hypothetical protein|nr:hypothetical protein [Pyrinomonadaceae bacterium]